MNETSPRRFVFLFALFAGVGFGLLLTPPLKPGFEYLTRAIAGMSAGIIRMAGGNVQLAGAVLTAHGAGFSMQVLNGCNGFSVVVLLWSAMLAWPASPAAKLKGMALGALLLQAVNTVRIISLFYLGQWNMVVFDWMHVYVWETLIVVLGAAVFAVWVRRTPPHGAADRAR